MNDQKLKPCPHCGNELDTNDDSRSSLGKYYLSCMSHDCGYEGPARKTLEEAISATNTRTPDPMLEELAGALTAANKFADNYHWAICSSLRNKIKSALAKYQQSKVQP